METEMKPGDKVWIFYEDEIEEWEYDECYDGSPMIVDPKGLRCSLNGRIWPFFDSREALFEHYRKIFE